jgi:RimJ/RimL family protein N-acetyltransferase
MQTHLFPAEPYIGHYPGIGRLSLRPVDGAGDVHCLHGWLNAEHARFWGMNGYSFAHVADYLRQLDRNPHAAGFCGSLDGEALFWVETYAPRHDPVGEHYPVAPGDRGMHFLVAPPTRHVRGLTRAVMHCIQSWMFRDPVVKRIVVEPDIRNLKIHPINLGAGFVYERQIELANKRAWLGFCQRDAVTPVEKVLA